MHLQFNLIGFGIICNIQNCLQLTLLCFGDREYIQVTLNELNIVVVKEQNRTFGASLQLLREHIFLFFFEDSIKMIFIFLKCDDDLYHRVLFLAIMLQGVKIVWCIFNLVSLAVMQVRSDQT